MHELVKDRLIMFLTDKVKFSPALSKVQGLNFNPHILMCF
jgi:hypothetical protein